jgi:hypothetical protein
MGDIITIRYNNSMDNTYHPPPLAAPSLPPLLAAAAAMLIMLHPPADASVPPLHHSSSLPPSSHPPLRHPIGSFSVLSAFCAPLAHSWSTTRFRVGTVSCAMGGEADFGFGFVRLFFLLCGILCLLLLCYCSAAVAVVRSAVYARARTHAHARVTTGKRTLPSHQYHPSSKWNCIDVLAYTASVNYLQYQYPRVFKLCSYNTQEYRYHRLGSHFECI